MTREAPVSRIRVFDTVVREVVRETHDTVTLLLDAGAEPRDYRPGQFVTIDPAQFPALKQQVAYFEEAKRRKEQVRAYSLASIPEEPWLAVTVKEEVFVPGETEYPPILSPYLVHAARDGMNVTVRGFTGTYTLPDDLGERTDHVVHLVAGSGVVPNFAMIRWALTHVPGVRHTLLDTNRTSADVIFSEALQKLERAAEGRLQVIHCLTREPADVPGAHRGRIDLELLRATIPDPSSCLVFACGPAVGRWEKKAAKARGEEPRPRFLETAQALLEEVGVPKEHIHTEAYG
jgi:3-ketosteroid 9alpha-monooxygenase subunit B